MDNTEYEQGMKDAYAGLLWYENPTGSKDWLDGHDAVSTAMKRGAWFAAEVEQKRAARRAAIKEETK